MRSQRNNYFEYRNFNGLTMPFFGTSRCLNQCTAGRVTMPLYYEKYIRATENFLVFVTLKIKYE